MPFWTFRRIHSKTVDFFVLLNLLNTEQFFTLPWRGFMTPQNLCQSVVSMVRR
jgi:hypothetical protein